MLVVFFVFLWHVLHRIFAPCNISFPRMLESGHHIPGLEHSVAVFQEY